VSPEHRAGRGGIRSRGALVVLLALALGGCSFVRVGENLPRAIADQPDPELARSALPAYLLLSDALVEGDPDNPRLLAAAARLYTSYAALFVRSPEREKVLADRGFGYGQRALCARRDDACGLADRKLREVEEMLPRFGHRDVPVLHAFAVSWLERVKSRSGDFSAMIDLAPIEAILDRIVALDETFDGGSADLYLGILDSLRPPALGGKPEQARAHFERALALSHGANLSAKVELAGRYARAIFDRELHDRLLHEVLEAPTEAPGYTLQNVLAKERAKELLASADDWF